ncbi:hypothetical protein [Streptomyces sp. SAJ15]|uniref:hypothetical protein n=1 Tax=Streptomyces sp. SAJ15 TaxID=2011095 RepID=UPI0011861E1F|nr:hypothetical protein [Streptomyces sp. SAJ15]TVL90123.1 hypothetical protein CD790_23595 [Streptomyces sp. SAJ15]
MSAWRWEYDPSEEYVIDGLPPSVVVEVERVAESLTVLGDGATEIGVGPASGGGLRNLDVCQGAGLLWFLCLPRKQLIVITSVVWNG